MPSLNGGGAERAAVQVLNRLDPARWTRTMYLFQREGPYLAALDPGITLVAGGAATRVERWCALRTFLRQSRPDLVVSFLSYFTVLSATVAAFCGARIVFNQQTPMSAFLEDADYEWRRPWHRRLFAAVTSVGYRMADAIVATSAGVADDLVRHFGVAADRIRILHNPVDLEMVQRQAADALDPRDAQLWTRPVLVAAGRLAHAKNYPLMFDALALIRRDTPAARLFVLGAGPLDAELRAAAAARDLSGAVVFAGFQQNPWKYIARADLFVLTSLYEGFGNVLVEAMACGVPVVATSSPGTREIITSNRDGVLVDSHDAAAFAQAVQTLLADEGRRASIAANARTTAQRFGLAAVAADYDRVLNQVLA